MMKTQALGAASALLCDYDDIEACVRSLHCPMFSLFTFPFHPHLHICRLHSSLSRVVRISLHIGVPPFPHTLPLKTTGVSYLSFTFRSVPSSTHTIALSQNTSVPLLMPLVYLVYYGSMAGIHSQTILVL